MDDPILALFHRYPDVEVRRFLPILFLAAGEAQSWSPAVKIFMERFARSLGVQPDWTGEQFQAAVEAYVEESINPQLRLDLADAVRQLSARPLSDAAMLRFQRFVGKATPAEEPESNAPKVPAGPLAQSILRSMGS